MKKALEKYCGWIETGTAILLGLVLLASGLGKALYPYQFLRSVEAYRLVNTHAAFYVALVLPSAELLIALCLLAGIARGGALLCAIGLGVLFVFVNASVMVRSMVVPCGCFGGGSNGETVGMWTLMRAIAVLLAAIIGLAAAMGSGQAWQQGTRSKPSEVPPVPELVSGQP